MAVDGKSEMRMKIKALAPWFGGKRSLAPVIVKELGKHRVYWDVCCGSMAILLAKPPCIMETVNDLHRDLTNLAWVIQDPIEGPRLYRRLRRVWMAEELFSESREVLLAGECEARMDPDRAFHYFITTWQGRNGVAGTANYNIGYCLRYTAKGGHAAKRWGSVVESIPQWRRRMRNVTILRRDAFSLLERIGDASGTAIYCDPPYLKKGACYVHDFETEEHHRLAKLLRRFKKARVVVSYYDDPLLAEMYLGWTTVRCTMTKALVNQGMRDGGAAAKAPEVLLINGESYTQDDGDPLFQLSETANA